MSPSRSTQVVLIAAVVWAASLFAVPLLFGKLLNAINSTTGDLDPFLWGMLYNFVLGPALSGGIAGYCTTLLLRQLPGLGLIRAKPIISIAIVALALGIVFLMPTGALIRLFTQGPQPVPAEFQGNHPPGPVEDFVTGLIAWIIPGLLFGHAVALEISQHGPKINSKQIALIAAGWSIGFSLCFGLWKVMFSSMISLFSDGNRPAQFFVDLVLSLPDVVRGLMIGLIGMWFTLLAIRSDSAALNPVERGSQA